jgi:signal transduction histidine kinase
MSGILPRSLFGQTVVILLLGLVLSHLFGGWIYTNDREQAVRAVGGLAVAQRIANVTHLIEDAPADWRGRIVGASSDPNFRVSVATTPPAFRSPTEPGPIAQAIKEFVVAQLPGGSARQVHVAASETQASRFDMPMGHSMPMGAMMHVVGAWRDLQVAIELSDRQWLVFTAGLPDTGPAMSWLSTLSMAAAAVVIVLVSIWAVRRVTAPLATLAEAAERLGRDLHAAPLPAMGTSEMRRAARAFNEMQERLRRLIDNRTRLLAAISHDLRTPLTLLRLRAENVVSEEDREKMLATITAMDAMIDASLRFARGETIAERRRPVDLAALLSSIVDDMGDAGLAVTMAPADELIYECQAEALKRAITNLLDNAIKYGKSAHIGMETTPKTIEIIVDDEGPGIPEQELTRVLQPFYRLDTSRSAETGGSGLGLAIAQSIAEAHGGRLSLANRHEGGLRAVITLPR